MHVPGTECVDSPSKPAHPKSKKTLPASRFWPALGCRHAWWGRIFLSITWVLKVRVGTLLYLTHALVLYSTVTGHEGTPREPWDAPLQRWLCMALLWLHS